MSLTSVIGEQR